MASEVVMPKMGYDMEEGKIVQWMKQEGDEVQKGEAIAEIETGKVNIEVEAFDSGILRQIVVGEGETVPVGEIIAWIAGPDEVLPDVTAGDGAAQQVLQETAVPPEHAPEAVPVVPPPIETDEAFPPVGGVKSSPLARRIAAEHGIDIALVAGTGPGGRVTRDDVEAYLAEQEAAPARPAAPEPVRMVAPERLPEVPAERVALSPLWKTLGRRMLESKTQVPHFYISRSIDMGKALELRAQINDYLQEAEGIKVSVNDFIVKAAARTLRKFPRLNASFAGEDVVLHRQINIGVAVATGDGLITLVIPNADRKSLSELASETRDKVTRASEGKLRADDFEVDGTFTISNLGMYGVDEFIAIVNPPEAAIMAVGAVQPTPVVKDGQVVVAQMMRVTVSGDHRVVSGADVAEFLAEFKRVLESPMALLA